MRCVHGPVRPVWQHGSSFTYIVRAARALAGVLEREHLRVRLAGARVPALPDDDAVRRHDHRADQRIRRRDAFSATGMKQRAPHEVGVGHHFSWKIASTYSRGENGSRSSTPSPTPT